MTDLVVWRGTGRWTANFGAWAWPCAIGRGGVTGGKREGDGATPVGRWPLRRVLYRADRLARPVTGLPCRALEAHDGWCDDPGDPAYNSWVRLPFAASHERLWRDDALYDIIVVLGHNDEPTRAGRGSAIFLHLAHVDYRPTDGCVALAKEHLVRLLAEAEPGAAVVVKDATA